MKLQTVDFEEMLVNQAPPSRQKLHQQSGRLRHNINVLERRKKRFIYSCLALNAYLSALGRNPVWGEYLAIRDWWSMRKTREIEERKIAYAKRVCANFQKRIGTTV